MRGSPIGDERSFVLAQSEPREHAAGRAVAGTAEQSIAPTVARFPEPMRPDRWEVSGELGSIQEMSGAFAQRNAALARKEHEFQICQNYLRVEKSTHFRAGANRFLAYLEGEQKSLAEVTTSDLQVWSRTLYPSGKGKTNMPSERIIRGAKGLCAFAAQVGYIDAPLANEIAEFRRQPIETNELRSLLQNPILTSEECASLIHLNYQMAEKSANRQAGANAFLTYLQNQKKSLAEVSTSDLERWALTPLPRGHFKSNLPNSVAFEGAKELCALAAQVGYIQAQSAKDFAAYTRPQYDLGSLRRVLQNPVLTRKEHENHIRLFFQSVDKQSEHQVGARAMLEYLESQGRSLAEVSVSDLERWALTPVPSRFGRINVPSARAFEGAKALCALAAQAGYIEVHRAKQLAEFKRPQFGIENLRTLLQNPALTPKEREYHIRLNYQASQNNANHHAGATGFLAYLENANIALSEVSTRDLRHWALTPLKGTRSLPEPYAFEGAKALCALAAEVGHLDGQRAQALATCKRPHFDVDLLSTLLQNPELTPKGREHQIHLTYQSMDKDPLRQSGAKGIMEYLEKQGRSLSEVTTSDLQQWALTPISTGRAKGRLPNLSSFEGAKALCALAGEVGYLDPQRAQNLAWCTRPQADIGSLRMLIQNPELTRKERDSHISLHYQSVEKNANALSGASGFLAFLESQHLSLAEASKSDLERWALTPIATGKSKKYLPSLPAFAGAKALCAVAAEVGYLDPQQAQTIATCMRPRFDVDSLRMVLQNPALTHKEREHQIRLNYQSSEKNHSLIAGANNFCAYLERKEVLLADVTKSDLQEWALTPLDRGVAKGALPSQLAFNGARALCALAAEVGYIDAQRAMDIAESTLPQPLAPSTSTVHLSEAGLHAAESSSAILERANKRLRSDDQGPSTSIVHSFTFPHSDALFRELALSPPSLLEPNQYAGSPQAGSPQTLIDELESLEDILRSHLN